VTQVSIGRADGTFTLLDRWVPLMTVTALPLPVPIAAPVGGHLGLGALVRRAGVNVGIGCVVPAAVFYTLFAVAGVWAAILAALAWSYGALGWRILAGRRAPAVLLLTTALLTARTGVALATDSAFVYFLQPVVTDGLVAAAFLLSLRTGRPLAGRLAVDFYPVDDELAARPRVSRLFRGLTAAWAALWLAKAAIGLWLLLTQPLETYVPVKAVVVLAVHLVAVLVTVVASAHVARREGLLAI